MSGLPKVPDLLVERLALGELDEKRAEAVRARLAATGDLDRLEALALSDRQILEAHPPRVVAASLTGRLAARAPRRSLMLLGPALAAALLAVWLLPSPDAPEVTRIKGGPALAVWARGAEGPVLLQDGDAASPGDLLQLGYRVGAERFGVIASVDGRGAVTLHFPANARASTQLESSPHTLPFAYELDDAPHFERFVFVSGPAPIDVGAVLSALREAPGSLPAWGPELTVVELTLEKSSGDLP